MTAISAAPVPAYLDLMSCFPTGVAVVTAVEGDGLRGMTCTSLASVTLCPPTLLVCLNQNGGTLAAVRACGRFGVNLLHAEASGTARLFATPGVDRFGAVAWRFSERLGVPWLTEDALALAECLVTDLLVVGDHEVVLGHVVHVERVARKPLLYGMRQFSSW